MTNITALSSLIDKKSVSDLFKSLGNRYGITWHNRLGKDADWLSCLNDWFFELKEFEKTTLDIAREKCFKIYEDYPPTLGQLVRICLQESGVPSEEQVMKSMISRDFNHPLVKIIYDKIGSWSLTHGKEEDVKSKTKQFYGHALSEFRENPSNAWDNLHAHKTQLALEAPVSTKIPSNEERKSFKQRMDEYMDLANSQKLKLGEQGHPVFPENKIKKGNREFDTAVYAEYKTYLLSVDETLSLTLPKKYAYDRICFLRELETIKHLRETGYHTLQGRVQNVAQNRNSGPTKIYKNFGYD